MIGGGENTVLKFFGPIDKALFNFAPALKPGAGLSPLLGCHEHGSHNARLLEDPPP